MTKRVVSGGAISFQEWRRRPHNTLMVDTGDCFQGSAVAALSSGRAVVPCVNRIGLDLVTSGNWEVVYGYSRGIRFTRPEEDLDRYVRILREDKGCQLVFVLSHLGPGAHPADQPVERTLRAGRGLVPPPGGEANITEE